MSPLSALQKSFFLLLNPRILLRVLGLYFATSLLWLFISINSWDYCTLALANLLKDTLMIIWVVKIVSIFKIIEPMIISQWVGVLFYFIFILIGLYLALLIATSVFLIPVLLKQITKTDFPLLERKHGGSNIGSLINSLVATLIYIAFFLVSLPLLLIPGLQILFPVLLNAYLAKTILCYDVLQDFATTDEKNKILQENRTDITLLSLTHAIFFYIPVLNLLAPAIGPISFIYLLLSKLDNLRSQSN